MSRIVMLVLIAGCRAPEILNPTGAEWGPCNHYEFECPDKGCCLDGWVCGGEPFSGCPADSCCDEKQNSLARRAKRAQ